MTDNPLVGAWELVAHEVPLASPEHRHPLGPRPLGALLYSPDGYMAVHYMAGDRPPLASANWRDATDEERLAAVRTYGGYSGRYTWLGDRVEHHVDASVNPNWIGQTLSRDVEFRGADLVLYVGAQDPGQPPTPVLTWRRRG